MPDVDPNLLVVFNHLLVERRVARVAGVLGVTQPTPFAEQLAEPVGYALAMIQGALNQHSHFDPATAKRDFTIYMTEG